MSKKSVDKKYVDCLLFYWSATFYVLTVSYNSLLSIMNKHNESDEYNWTSFFKLKFSLLTGAGSILGVAPGQQHWQKQK